MNDRKLMTEHSRDCPAWGGDEYAICTCGYTEQEVSRFKNWLRDLPQRKDDRAWEGRQWSPNNEAKGQQ